MATIEQITQQLVEVLDRLKTAETIIQVMRDLGMDKAKPKYDKEFEHGELVDAKKFFAPVELTTKSVFPEWAEDFIDFVESRDNDLAEKLRTAREQLFVIASLGDNPDTVERGQKMYRVLKRVVIHPEARALVVNAPDKNVWEAWRQLYNRFDPRNDAAANSIVQRLMDWRAWKCKTIHDIPIQITKWEGLEREHKRRTGEDILSDPVRKEILLTMIPPAMKEHIRIHTMLIKKEDLTYQKLRTFILDYAQQSESVAVPMDMSSFSAAEAAAAEAAKWSAEYEEEPLDSFGKGPKGGGVGKGGGKGKKDDNTTCNVCGRKGHWSR